jgi:hypothetical protein
MHILVSTRRTFRRWDACSIEMNRAYYGMSYLASLSVSVGSNYYAGSYLPIN